MTQAIKCSHCGQQGWDSYLIGGKLHIECAKCECEIIGDFVMGEDGWIKQIQKVGA